MQLPDNVLISIESPNYHNENMVIYNDKVIDECGETYLIHVIQGLLTRLNKKVTEEKYILSKVLK